jgi:thiaminase
VQTRELLGTHAHVWETATRHRFLDEIRTGELPDASLNTWLAQDYHFVDRLLRFQSLLLASAPRQHQLVLAQGLVALAEELDWFQAIARSRGLDLTAPLHPDCEAYTNFLLGLGAGCGASPGDSRSVAYTIAITALWTVERAYLDAWLGARPEAPTFAGFVEHWTAEVFHGYVAGLAAAADRALDAVPAAEHPAEQAFLRVAGYERNFWQIAFGS